MDLLRRLFAPRRALRLADPVSRPASTLNEDDGYKDHMVGQAEGPFYCGTAFCGHSTKKAARECWKKKCDAIDAIIAEANSLREAGKNDEAAKVEGRAKRYYPELNPENFPINRSSAAMQTEYIERAQKESLAQIDPAEGSTKQPISL
jgi:hypothetical protein